MPSLEGFHHPACGRSFLAGSHRMPVTWVRGVLFLCLCTKSGRLQKVERAQSVPTARHQHRNGCTHHRPHWDATFFLSILEWLRAQTQSCSTWTTLRGDMGIRETRFTNMSAGVSILVNKRSWKARHVVMIFDAPSKLQGRTGFKVGRKASLRMWCTGLQSGKRRAAERPVPRHYMVSQGGPGRHSRTRRREARLAS